MFARRFMSMRKAVGIACALCALTVCCIFALSGCSRTMDYIIANEPSMKGTVTAVYENSFIMLDERAEEYSVSLNPENKDSYTSLSIGDEVVVYYNGDVAESNPPQIATVYAITLRTPADNRDADQRG